MAALSIALSLTPNCGSRFALGEVNAEERRAVAARDSGQRMLIVRGSGGTESEAPRFYADEVLSPVDHVGWQWRRLSAGHSAS